MKKVIINIKIKVANRNSTTVIKLMFLGVFLKYFTPVRIASKNIPILNNK